MSERIEILNRLNAAFNARDADWTRYYMEDAEFRMPPDWPDDPVLRGRAGIARGAGLWGEQLDDYGWDQARLIELGDCVVGLYHHRGRIHGTEQRVESEVGALFYFAGALIARVVSFSSWAEALEAAGVEDR